MQEKKRYAYIDNMKLAGCVLVALGHLLMSLNANSLMHFEFYDYFKQTLYTFHVPIFFVCSGFLYQKSNRVTSFGAYKKELPKKLLDLGVPYFVFTSVTLFLKTLFENDVTTKASPYLDTLIMHPTAPYWFLYTLFLMFLLIPCMKNKKSAATLFGFSFLIKVLYVILQSADMLVKPKNVILLFFVLRLESFCNSAIWFCGGMLLSFLNEDTIKKYGKFISPVLLIIAVVISVIFYLKYQDFSYAAQFIIGLFFVLFTVVIAVTFSPEPLNKISFKFSEYFMPVFVLHTICAAPIRILLLKIGIDSFIVHLIGGLTGSFAIPIVIYLICKKLTPLMFFFYPTKTVKLMKRKKNGKIQKTS